MKQTLLHEKYPLFVMELGRDETELGDIDAVCGYFRRCIDSHHRARFIAELDHFAHTPGLPEEAMAAEIRAARNIVFCFGISLPSAQALAVRPRSIGIAETDQGYVISFLEAPMPVANAAMEDWAEGLRRQPEASAATSAQTPQPSGATR